MWLWVNQKMMLQWWCQSRKYMCSCYDWSRYWEIIESSKKPEAKRKVEQVEWYNVGTSDSFINHVCWQCEDLFRTNRKFVMMISLWIIGMNDLKKLNSDVICVLYDKLIHIAMIFTLSTYLSAYFDDLFHCPFSFLNAKTSSPSNSFKRARNLLLISFIDLSLSLVMGVKGNTFKSLDWFFHSSSSSSWSRLSVCLHGYHKEKMNDDKFSGISFIQPTLTRNNNNNKPLWITQSPTIPFHSNPHNECCK